MVALRKLDEPERPRSDRIIDAIRLLHRHRIEHVHRLEDVADVGVGLVRGDHERIFVRRLNAFQRRNVRGEDAAADRRILHPVEIPQRVIAGEFAAGVVLDPFPQVELELGVVRVDVPAFGKPGLPVELLVQQDQPVEHVENVRGARRSCGRRASRCCRAIPIAVFRHSLAARGLGCSSARRVGAGAVVAAAAGFGAVVTADVAAGCGMQHGSRLAAPEPG